MRYRVPIVILVLVQTIAAQNISINAVGDIMLGTDFPHGYLPPPDKENILEPMQKKLRDADLTFGNLEGVFCEGGVSEKCSDDTSRCFAFRMPPHYAQFLADAGFDLISLANNHTSDFGDSCLTVTEDLIDSLGMSWSGRRGSYALRQVGDISVGFMACHSSSRTNNSLMLGAARTSISRLKDSVDVLIVSIQGGAEGNPAIHLPDTAEYYYEQPRGHMRRFCRMAVDAGADLVLGHGPHVPRALEMYKDRLIAYSLGNFATYRRFSMREARQYGCILSIDIDATGRFMGGRIVGTIQRNSGIPFPDPENHFAELASALTLTDIEEPHLLIDLDGTIYPLRP